MSPSTWSWNKETHEKQSWKNESKVKRNEELSWKTKTKKNEVQNQKESIKRAKRNVK
jgi:hypothetical protein